jgi:xanthine dehydrogenase YagR molybdenum-binding subunit
MPDYHWPPPEKRRVIGKRLNRVDGIVKTSGRAKYSYDIKRPGMLYGAVLTSPHAHARITGLDTSAAEKMKGVAAVQVVSPPGTEIQWAGAEVVAVAAVSEQVAKDAIRKIKVDYEVLPHMVHEEDLSKVGSRAKPSGEQVFGDPDQAFKDADAVSEGFYGVPVITHVTWETHGQVIEWKGQDMDYWSSTQAVSSIGGELAKNLGIPATSVHVHQDHMGIGYGSKFSCDRWGVFCAQLSKASGGKAVKLFLDRATDQMIAGNRPSHFARIKLAAKQDGAITGWQSESWSTGGMGGAGMPPIPYVFTRIPNRRLQHTAVQVNAGGQRAWRAPNHPQAAYLTCCAMEDLAAKLNMDPIELFSKNADYTLFPDVYRWQLQKAAEMVGWKKLWHPRGDSGKGAIKRGLGIGVCTWGGAGHASQCRTNIHPDGTVEIELCSQDLGTGTRTVIVMVAAETLGLPVSAIKLNIGDNKYPPSGSSGGSTTVGGVSSSTRKSTMNALEKLYEVVAPSLDAPPDQLEAVDGKIQVKGNPAKSLPWKAACKKLGVNPISAMGENQPKLASKEGLNTGNVAGAQIADVSVDTETGIVKMNRLAVVQDCGMIINPKTAESQCFGAAHLSICAALCEERIMDEITGRMLNPNLEFYKLAGMPDIGEIIVHLDIRPEHDKRGVVGLGEPPVIGGIAAVANAVTNAIGVRIPVVPLTPDKVLAALEGRKA